MGRRRAFNQCRDESAGYTAEAGSLILTPVLGWLTGLISLPYGFFSAFLCFLYIAPPPRLSNSYGLEAPNALAGGCRFIAPASMTTILLLVLGVALFGALAGYVIFCDRV
ncbi:hypothetical protein [Nevskia soli]|uniref:hypothetical protein n=1 Tax=Nevskia soli TaxID=418856 RepID=UPI0012FB5A02|nr:hypothetical protein [Nevskia soli]